MPRASWKGFLRLSLVSCPIYLSPATTRTKSIRLHQVWQPQAARQDLNEDDEEGGQPDRTAARSMGEDSRDDIAPERLAASRVSLLPHDRRRRRFQDPWLTCWLIDRKFLGYWRCWREQRLGRLTRSRHPLAIIGIRAGRGVTAISGPTWWMIFAHIFCNWIAMDCAHRVAGEAAAVGA